MVVDMVPCQLLAYALFALAQRRHPAPHRRHMLAPRPVHARHERCIDLPAARRSPLLDGLQGAKYHAGPHPYQALAPHGLADLGIQPRREGQPARLGRGALGPLARRLAPRSLVRQEGRRLLLEAIGEAPRHAAWRQALDALGGQALRPGPRALAHGDRQQERGDGVDRGPHPLRGTRQPRDGVRLPYGTGFDRTEPGKECIELHLCDVDVLEDVLGEGCEMVGGFDEPREHGMRGDLEHAGDRSNPQACRPRPYRPHQQIGRHPLARKAGAMGLKEGAPTAAARQLAPGATMGMAGGPDMASPQPAAIGTIGSRADMARGGDRTTASLCGAEARWRGTGCWGTGRNGLFTGVAEGLVGETGKGCGLAGALVGWRGGLGWTLTVCGPIAWPAVVEHDAQPEQSE